MSDKCPKCQQIKEFIQQCRDNPPPMSFEVEGPFGNALESIEAILKRKSLIELAAYRAKQTGSHKDLKRYLTIRNDRE